MERLKKTLKMCTALLLALVIAMASTGTTVEAASKKITVAKVGKTKVVKSTLYKGGSAHKAKVKFNSSTYVGTANGYNVYYVDYTLNRGKLSTKEAIGISKEMRKKGLYYQYYTYTSVLTNSKGKDISGSTLNFDSNYSTVTDSSEKSKTVTYKSGWMRYKSTLSYYKTTNYKMYVVVPATQTDVYVGIAGLKNGQPSSSKMSSYKLGNCTFTKAGFGGKKANITAIKLQ